MMLFELYGGLGAAMPGKVDLMSLTGADDDTSDEDDVGFNNDFAPQSFVQTSSKSSKAAPQLGGAKSDSAGGIVSILETMGEEFRKTVKENQSTEREAVKAFEKMVNDIGLENASDPVLAELQGATVLTVGTADDQGRAAGFQIKVANAGNTCYMDAVLFSMFAMPSTLDAMLTKRQPAADHLAVQKQELQASILKQFVGRLATANM